MAKRKRPSYIRELRAFYGMTQSALAFYLGVTRSQLAMAEVDERELPSEASLKVTRLLAAMTTASPGALDQGLDRADKKQDARQAKRTKAQLDKAQKALVAAEEKLEKLKEDHSRAVSRMASLDILRNNGIELDAALCDHLAIDARKLFEKSNPDAQRRLEEKINDTRTEIIDLKKMYKGKL